MSKESKKRTNDISSKVKDAAKILASSFAYIESLLVPEANIPGICLLGDEYLVKSVDKIYTKFDRGIAFPTTISPNNIISNFAPLRNVVYKLREGDVVKVEQGIHIDGYPVVLAKTFIINTLGASISDKRANVLMAANVAAKCILNTMKPTTKWHNVKKIVDMVAAEFDCFPIFDIQLAQLGRYKLYAQKDGDRDNKSSILSPSGPGMIACGRSWDSSIREKVASSCDKEDGKKETKETKVLENDVGEADISIWSFNIGMSSCNDEKAESEVKSTIYEQVPNAHYSLKFKASRQVFSAVKKSLGFPFSVNILVDEKGEEKEKKKNLTERQESGHQQGNEVYDSPLSASTRIGLKECFDHKLINNYRILEVGENEFVSRIRFTILLHFNGTITTLNDPININGVEKIIGKKIENEQILSFLK
jgi:hypothetical protein